MKFECKYYIVYYKNENYEKFDNNKGIRNNKNIWYYNGYLLHREDGPALEYVDISYNWFLNGKLHREDGPAIEWNSKDKEWYLNGQRYLEEEYLSIINLKSKSRVLNEI